jgi:uncharacterized surface protein with fasciclin (FAS1) repeats
MDALKDFSEESSAEVSSKEDEEYGSSIIQVITVADNATVVDTDIIALNGVIHAIDTVV